jgi:hypothetical protein
MAESTPHLAPIVVLLFLGALFVTGVSIGVFVYGAVRRSRQYARIGGGAALGMVTCYMLLLCGVSLASSERVLPVGAWKYFCEIDCHIGYSVSSVRTAASIGPEGRSVAAHGQFVIVQLKVRFDEHTVSPNRGDGPLTPNARRVVLLESSGHAYEQSPEGERMLAGASGEQESLRQALRPGQSFTKDLVFDGPRDRAGLRLLITEDDPETHLIIGHENSLLHKKIYLSLDPPQNIAITIKPLGPN